MPRAYARKAKERAKVTGHQFANFDWLAQGASIGEFTFERAAEESQVPIERIRSSTAEIIANAGDRKSPPTTGVAASMGNRGGWQVARSLFFLNVLTGSVGTQGGTSA